MEVIKQMESEYREEQQETNGIVYDDAVYVDDLTYLEASSF